VERENKRRERKKNKNKNKIRKLGIRKQKKWKVEDIGKKQKGDSTFK
jgi:hypothetical protein